MDCEGLENNAVNTNTYMSPGMVAAIMLCT